MGTAIRPAGTTPASWDAISDVDAFVEEVLFELTAMANDGTRPARTRPKAPLTGAALGITIQPIARGRDGVFIPTEIAWVVERSFGWLSRYRQLNTIVERTKEHLVAFTEIAFISILSRRLKRLVTQGISRMTSTNSH